MKIKLLILLLETYFHEGPDTKDGTRIEGGLHEDPHILNTLDEGNPCIAASNTMVSKTQTIYMCLNCVLLGWS